MDISQIEKFQIHIETDAEHNAKVELLMKEKSLNLREAMECFIDQTSFLSPELLKKLDNFFIEGTHEQKLNFMVANFLKWHEKFPYLNIQKEITPEDAGFPTCPLVKAVYWKNEFLGFHCRAIKPLVFRLPIMKVGILTLQITTSKDCWECMELCKQAKAGFNLLPKVSFEQIDLHKKEMKKIDEQNKTQPQREITNKLEGARLRMSYEDVKKVFKYLRYDNRAQKWKGLTNASKRAEISRPTIYKLLEIFPEGILIENNV